MSSSTFRGCRLAVLLLFLVPAGGWLALRRTSVEVAFSMERPVPQARGALGTGTLRSLPSGLDVSRQPAAQGSAVDGAEDSGSSPPGREETGPESEAWELVERLRTLARDPQRYHADALSVVSRLTEVCAREPARPRDAGGLIDQLLRRVVDEEQEADLVRGAVWLALSTLLTASRFQSTFEAWFEDPDTAPELLRTAALAAARRGSKTSCPYPLLLGKLAELALDGPVEPPSFYPLRLDRVMESYEADVLRAWLTSGDPRASRFTLAAPARDPSIDMQDLTEFLVTSEVLFVLWGHRALVDDEVRAVVAREALLGTGSSAGGSLLFFRAAGFLVHALAPCDGRLSATASSMAASESSLVVSMAEQMSGMAPAGLTPSLVGEIEETRYSTDPGDNARLILTLIEVGQDLQQLCADDPQRCEDACFYVDGFVQDPALPDAARSAALAVIRDAGREDLFIESAARVLESNGPDPVAAIALLGLIELARADEALQAATLEVLSEARLGAVRAWLQADLDRYIAELSD